jgi:hypothetical protein
MKDCVKIKDNLTDTIHKDVLSWIRYIDQENGKMVYNPEVEWDNDDGFIVSLHKDMIRTAFVFTNTKSV